MGVDRRDGCDHRDRHGHHRIPDHQTEIPARQHGSNHDRRSVLRNTAAGRPFAAFAPPSPTEIPRLTPFVGTWHAHEESLDIQSDGHGRETYNDRSTCPDAPMSGCGIQGSTEFILTSVSGDTAIGTITAATDSKQPIGGPVSVRLVRSGQGVDLSIAGGDQGFPFCNSNDPAAAQYYCGA